MDDKPSFFTRNEEGERYAIAIATSLGLSIEDGKKAVKYWPCKSCILAYLYALYLKLLDKYLALLEELEEVNFLEKNKFHDNIWKRLEQDKIALQRKKADECWLIIQRALQEINMQQQKSLFDAVNKLNNHNSIPFKLK